MHISGVIFTPYGVSNDIVYDVSYSDGRLQVEKSAEVQNTIFKTLRLRYLFPPVILFYCLANVDSTTLADVMYQRLRGFSG